MKTQHLKNLSCKEITFTLFALACACLLCPLQAQIQPERYLLAAQIEVDAEISRGLSRKAVAFSFIGAYEKALTTYELDQPIREGAGEKESELSAEEAARFGSYQAVNAVEGITKLVVSSRSIQAFLPKRTGHRQALPLSDKSLV